MPEQSNQNKFAVSTENREVPHVKAEVTYRGMTYRVQSSTFMNCILFLAQASEAIRFGKKLSTDTDDDTLRITDENLRNLMKSAGIMS